MAKELRDNTELAHYRIVSKIASGGMGEVYLAEDRTLNRKVAINISKGVFQWNKRTGESLRRSVEFLEEAIKKDPNYALAYSGLAESYVLYGSYAAGMPLEVMPKARAAALRAIELDDSSPEPHLALGIYLSTFSWNQIAAEKEFLRAIELNPNYPSAHQQVRQLLSERHAAVR